MYPCPHCGTDAFSFWQKELLRPARSIKCRHCGGRVGVPGIHTFVWLYPMFMLIVAVPLFLGARLGLLNAIFTGSLIAFAVSASLCHRYVALIPRKP